MELDRLEQIFGRDTTYVELQNAGSTIQQPAFLGLPGLAERRKLPLVATGDVHYLDATDAYAHEALLCIQSGDSLKNPNHWRFGDDEFYFKTPEEMALDFPGHEDAMRRTLEVAERCNVEIELGRILLPSSRRPTAATRSTTSSSCARRASSSATTSSTPELDERLQFELKTIREMGFADYFLIVADFVGFAKRNGVSVGPGRGSAAGSLAAYCLEITDIDPMRYGLLFERFLNPARKDMPDMDIDFAVEGRERVINYVAEKYGRDRVAQIITFSTMAARAAIRDAGRVLEIPYGVVDRIAKLVPEGPGQTLEEALKPGAELAKAVETDPVAKEIVDLARPLEGLTRADSIHAAGVVIGAQPLIEVVPLQQKGADQEVVTQFSMKNVEALGLLKMDFLGLRNLDVIDKAVALIGGGLDIGTIPLDDRKTYEMLARADSTGVFQFESSGMRDALRQVKPTEFEDLIALVALYRPGPMQYIPTYAARKNGREPVRFIDERLEAITGTHLRDLDLPGAVHADREAAGRLHPRRGRDAAPRDRQEDPRADGLAQGEVPRRLRRERRHPGGREAALEGHGVVAGLLLQQGARRLLRADRLPHRLAEGEPPVRVHGRAHLVRDEHEGPGAVLRQRVRRDGDRGAAARRELVRGRLRGRRGEDPLRPQRGQERRRDRGAARSSPAREEGGPFASIWDFTERVDPQVVNKRALESLVKCGALDSTGASRMGMLAVLEQALGYGQKLAPTGSSARARSSTSAFGDADDSARRAAPPADRDRRVREARAAAAREGDARPLRLRASARAVRDQLRRKTDATLAELERRRDGEVVTVGGIVSDVKHLTTKRGEPMVFLTLDDPTGSAEVVVFNSTYAAARELCVDRPDPRRQGPRRPQAAGRDEADRARADAVRGGRRAPRGALPARRARGARRRDRRARAARAASTRASRPSTSRSTPRRARRRSPSAPSTACGPTRTSSPRRRRCSAGRRSSPRPRTATAPPPRSRPRRAASPLEILLVRDRVRGGADADDGRVEVPEAVLGDVRGDLGAEAAELDGLVRDDEPVRLRDRRGDQVGVERDERARVDDLDADAVALELARRPERVRHSAPSATTVTSVPSRATRPTPSSIA